MMTNLRTTLDVHGYAMSDLVKCAAMLPNISQCGAFNGIYQPFFSDHFPTRAGLTSRRS